MCAERPRKPAGVGTVRAILPNIMTQLSLFETSRQISITEETIAVNFRGRWEIYMLPGHPAGYERESGIERFSHFATAAESAELWKARGS